MAQLAADGRVLEVTGDAMLLEVLGQAGVRFPRCATTTARSDRECRMCLVEIEGLTQPVSACTTPVSDGMVIHTATAELESVRRGLLEMIGAPLPSRGGGGPPGQAAARVALRATT